MFNCASNFCSSCCVDRQYWRSLFTSFPTILAEGAIALSVTLSGGALFASWKLLQFPSSLIVKVILAIFRRGFGPTTSTHSMFIQSNGSAKQIWQQSCFADTRKCKQQATTDYSITAFTSQRTNLSPFTKGCRERDASMWLTQLGGNLWVPTNGMKDFESREKKLSTLLMCW